ncbi:MAG: hypothetical protein BGN83_05645 [Rhizobium sp. 63-7]|nr:MAG: hypothetical protein BGN83_05645 [Rhizobium sp. 63-7]
MLRKIAAGGKQSETSGTAHPEDDRKIHSQTRILREKISIAAKPGRPALEVTGRVLRHCNKSGGKSCDIGRNSWHKGAATIPGAEDT